MSAEIRCNACHEIDNPARAQGFALWGRFNTVEERDAFVARFPRYVGVKKGHVNGLGNVFDASVHIQFRSNGTTGASNEAGIKRVRKALELAGAEWVSPYRNSFATVEQFLATL